MNNSNGNSIYTHGNTLQKKMHENEIAYMHKT